MCAPARARTEQAGALGLAACPIRAVPMAEGDRRAATPCHAGTLLKSTGRHRLLRQPLRSERDDPSLHEMEGASGLETATGQ